MLPGACLHSCLSSQCCLDVMQMGEVLGPGAGRAGTARSKNPFGTTVGWQREAGLWEGEEKRRCTGDLDFCWREILPVPEPAARRAAPLWPLPLSLDFSPLRAGAGAMWQLGEQPGKHLGVGGKPCLGGQLWLAGYSLPCSVLGRGGVQVQSLPPPLLGARLCFPFP